MFADPQSITVATVAKSLPRVSVGNRTATYTNGDESIALTLSHVSGNRGRSRRLVRVDFTKTAADPFVAGNNREVSMSTYLVIDEPSDNAFSNTEVLDNVLSLVGWLTSANLTKVIAGES